MSKETFLYILTTGWKSGKSHEIEIWYVEHAGSYYAVAEHGTNAHWVQNILRQPSVQVRVGKEAAWQAGSARTIDRAAEPALAQAVSTLMDAKYRWSNGLIVELRPLS